MNWFGIVVLGFAVGLLGSALNPLRRLSRASLWLAVAAGVLGAAAAKMAGNVAGLFYDGETLEWPVCTAAALFAVAVTVGLSARR